MWLWVPPKSECSPWIPPPRPPMWDNLLSAGWRVLSMSTLPDQPLSIPLEACALTLLGYGEPLSSAVTNLSHPETSFCGVYHPNRNREAFHSTVPCLFVFSSTWVGFSHRPASLRNGFLTVPTVFLCCEVVASAGSIKPKSSALRVPQKLTAAKAVLSLAGFPGGPGWLRAAFWPEHSRFHMIILLYGLSAKGKDYLLH